MLSRKKTYCACAVSHDLGVWVRNIHIFGIPDPDLSIHYTTFGAPVTIKRSLFMSLPITDLRL